MHFSTRRYGEENANEQTDQVRTSLVSLLFLCEVHRLLCCTQPDVVPVSLSFKVMYPLVLPDSCTELATRCPIGLSAIGPAWDFSAAILLAL